MGEPVPPPPAKYIVGMLSAVPALFEVAGEIIADRLGPVDYASDAIPFTYSTYYDGELGTPLLRRFISLAVPRDQGELAAVKLATNAIERELAGAGRRRINLDPGYLTRGKLVLATTKDYAHRIYLGSGIYAEVTLSFHRGEFRPNPWTYPDYASPEYHRVLVEIRGRYLQRLAQERRA